MIVDVETAVEDLGVFFTSFRLKKCFLCCCEKEKDMSFGEGSWRSVFIVCVVLYFVSPLFLLRIQF